jgi:hypothetical protein
MLPRQVDLRDSTTSQAAQIGRISAGYPHGCGSGRFGRNSCRAFGLANTTSGCSVSAKRFCRRQPISVSARSHDLSTTVFGF